MRWSFVQCKRKFFSSPVGRKARLKGKTTKRYSVAHWKNSQITELNGRIQSVLLLCLSLDTWKFFASFDCNRLISSPETSSQHFHLNALTCTKIFFSGNVLLSDRNLLRILWKFLWNFYIKNFATVCTWENILLYLYDFPLSQKKKKK